MYKICRLLSYSTCKNYMLIPPLPKKYNVKKLHITRNIFAKMFHENENKYAYKIMESNGYVMGFNNKEKSIPIIKDNFIYMIENNWLKESPQTIFETFTILSEYCSQHNICISNKKFDDYIDALTDSIKFATDDELKSIFYALAQFPETESIRTRNYIEVWAALDDECFTRIRDWTFDEMLLFVSLFYMLNVTKHSDFCQRCLLKLCDKAKTLTKSQVVQAFFFIGTTRKSPPFIHNLEIFIDDNLSMFSIDDLAIIAMGLFKSKTPVRSATLLSKIIDKILINSKEINEISLASLLKIIRYSAKKAEDNCIYNLLDCLQHEVPRLSLMCNVQMALVGTSTLTLHKDCLTEIANNTVMSTARLKDLERLVLTYGTFNYRPKTKTCFFSEVIEELRKPERTEEIKKHGRSYSCCIAYLTLLGIHPFDLMNNVLNSDFLQNAYGKHVYQYGREILTIHNTMEIFGKGENINQLTENQVVVLSKKYTDYVPSDEYKKQYNVTEKMFLDVLRVLRDMRGGKEFVIGHHIVTHHQRGDILMSNNHNGIPLPVEDSFKEKRFGLLARPPDNNTWVALVVAGKNTIIQNTNTPTGHFTTKIRELVKLGYKAGIVPWNIYTDMQTKDEKIDFLNSVIYEAINN